MVGGDELLVACEARTEDASLVKNFAIGSFCEKTNMRQACVMLQKVCNLVTQWHKSHGIKRGGLIPVVLRAHSVTGHQRSSGCLCAAERHSTHAMLMPCVPVQQLQC